MYHAGARDASEFRDVVFEDAVFDNDMLYLYPMIMVYIIWGRRTTVIKRPILKHHLFELPRRPRSLFQDAKISLSLSLSLHIYVYIYIYIYI